MEYRKYAWPTESQFTSDMISSGFAQLQDDQLTFINCAVYQIGKVCIAEDAEGICTQYDPRYAVDIIWNGEIQFEDLIVWPNPIGVHIFAGWEEYYTQEFCKVKPDSPYCTLTPEL
jgi:hypothetical protein